jgi:hypothetical protein
VEINVKHNSAKRAHVMAHLNFTAVRLPHEIDDKMQHKHDKNKHNNATMNCKTTRQIANNQQCQRTTMTPGTTTTTTENANAGSMQKRHHNGQSWRLYAQ